jgi:hypothetical protein
VHSFGYPIPRSSVPLPVRHFDEDAVALVRAAMDQVEAWQPSVTVTGEAVLGPSVTMERLAPFSKG